MPEMDGYEVIRQIKNPVQKNSPVIISISASAFYEDKQKAFETGCDGFVTKPFKESEIFEEMRKHLGLQFFSCLMFCSSQLFLYQLEKEVLMSGRTQGIHRLRHLQD